MIFQKSTQSTVQGTNRPTVRLFEPTPENNSESAIYDSHLTHKQPKRYELLPGKDDYTSLTVEFLSHLYPKICPTCNITLTKTVTTRSYVIRCSQCHHQSSRLKHTPLQDLKLPLYVFGWCLYESINRYPKVLSATEIQKRLGVAKNTATLLKRRLQLVANDQLPKLNKRFYDDLKTNLSDLTFPRDDKTDLTDLIKNKPIPQIDTMALYSASQRANKGRKRHRHGGLTASIYLSDKLGGEQIGTLVQTISWKNGPVIYDSIPDNTANTLMPLLNRHIGKDIPVFTDEGYKFYYRINKNHRMINHSLKSKDKRFRFSRERWSKNGIHTQVAEGHHRNLKWNFTAGYGYIRPKFSQLYLNEYAFWRNVKYYGWSALLNKGEDQVGDEKLQNANLSEKGHQRRSHGLQQADRPQAADLPGVESRSLESIRAHRSGGGDSRSGGRVEGSNSNPVEVVGSQVNHGVIVDTAVGRIDRSKVVGGGRKAIGIGGRRIVGGRAVIGGGVFGVGHGELGISSLHDAERSQTAKNGAKRSVRQVGREYLREKITISNQISNLLYKPLDLSQRHIQSDPQTRNVRDPIIQEILTASGNKNLRTAAEHYPKFMANAPDFKRAQQKKYAYLASVIWEHLSNDGWHGLDEILEETGIDRKKVYRVLRIWVKLGVIDLIDRSSPTTINLKYVYDLRKKIPVLPDFVYALPRDQFRTLKTETESLIPKTYRPVSQRGN